MEAWLQHLAKSVLRLYCRRLEELGLTSLGQALARSKIERVTSLDGGYDFKIDSDIAEDNVEAERLILDDVCGYGTALGTRISTILFVIEGKLDSLEIIAEAHEWPSTETVFDLTIGDVTSL